MRPNVDIPWSIHGEIKEYAERKDITIEDAYIEALREGIERLPTPEGVDSDTFAPEQESYPFGPKLIYSQGEESHHINRATACFPSLYRGEEPKRFGTRRQSLTIEEFTSRLSDLQSATRISEDWFTIHQLGGALVGRGISNFAQGIDEAHDWFEDAGVPQYKDGIVLYIGSLPRESEYLVLRAEIPRRQKVVSNLTATFVSDGTPISGREYYRIVSALGFSELFNAREHEWVSISGRFQEPKDVQVVDRIVSNRSDEEDPWVNGLIIKNPLQENPDLLSQVEWDVSEELDDRIDAESSLETLKNYDEIYCKLKDHHPASEDREYSLESISATYLSPLFNRNSIWNISPTANW